VGAGNPLVYGAYAKLVGYWPDFLQYETDTTRAFPVIRLEPVSSPTPAGPAWW
jgi:hypothetical protein